LGLTITNQHQGRVIHEITADPWAVLIIGFTAILVVVASRWLIDLMAKSK
jgi:hypothetical protein